MSNKNRIDKLDQELRNVQPTPEAVRWSLEEFEKTGQLPGDHVLGRWVVQQVLARPHADLRRMLFHEATHSEEVVRMPAQIVLQALFDLGRDVNDPGFVPHDVSVPEFGTLGLRMLGWPEEWVRPEHAAQAERLWKQCASLRSRARKDNDRWLQEAAASLGAFLQEGELPDDQLLFDFAFAYAEMLCLNADFFGRDCAAGLAAFDRAATADGAEREQAITELQELARAGRLLPG